jgi:tetratricopeptide (TPR) repeat protein
MPERIKRVRRRRRISAFPAAESFRFLRRGISPERLAIFFAAIALAVVLAILFFSYGTKIYAGWREKRLLQHASVLLQKQDFTGATAAAQTVLQLHPDSLPAYYILADATEKQNLLETVAWRAQIARLRHDLDSELNLASAALRFGELDTARNALEQVAPGDRDKAQYHVVAGWLARAQGDELGVREHFAAAVRKDPANELYQFNLAVLDIKSADAAKRDEARATLQKLTKVQQYRAGSLRALLNDAVDRKDLADADSLAQDLQMSPQVTFSDLLLCLNLYRKLDEKKFSILLEKVKPVAARNPTDLGLLIDWMNSNGLATEVLKWVEKLKPELTSSPPAAVSVAEAFATAKNWSRLKRWTRTGSWGKSDYLRLAYQAFAARQVRQAGADAEFESLWRAADRATEDDPQREVNLARLATKWNLFAEAEQLWIRITKNGPLRHEALDTLAKIYRGSNDLPNLYRTMQGLHEISPGDPDIAANYARLALLLDQNTAEGHRIAKEAYDRAPNNVNCAITYAFSLYGLGRTAAGLEIIRKLPPEGTHDPHAAAFVAVLLIDENQFDAAKEYIEIARKGPIFVEEKKLLDEALTKMNTPSPTPESASPTPMGVPMVPMPIMSAKPSSPPPAPAASPPPKGIPLPTPNEP